MEISLTVLIDAGNKELADFINLMWDYEKAPVELEEVTPAMHQAFEALEFIDIPETKQRVSETRLQFFYDALGDMDIDDDYIQPYLDAGAKAVVYIVDGDEGRCWHLKSQKKASGGKLKITFDDCDKDDIDCRMNRVADQAD